MLSWSRCVLWRCWSGAVPRAVLLALDAPLATWLQKKTNELSCNSSLLPAPVPCVSNYRSCLFLVVCMPIPSELSRSRPLVLSLQTKHGLLQPSETSASWASVKVRDVTSASLHASFTQCSTVHASQLLHKYRGWQARRLSWSSSHSRMDVGDIVLCVSAARGSAPSQLCTAAGIMRGGSSPAIIIDHHYIQDSEDPHIVSTWKKSFSLCFLNFLSSERSWVCPCYSGIGFGGYPLETLACPLHSNQSQP